MRREWAVRHGLNGARGVAVGLIVAIVFWGGLAAIAVLEGWLP